MATHIDENRCPDTYIHPNSHVIRRIPMPKFIVLLIWIILDTWQHEPNCAHFFQWVIGGGF